MKPIKKNIVYTIGHSTHTLEEFIRMLQAFEIETLVDIRRFPGSRKYPQFNKENLAEGLQSSGISYVHLENLGGRRKTDNNSKNKRWRNKSFQGYADYMATKDFEKGITQLEAIAIKQPMAYMCSEALWWRCHRSMVSDYLKAKGWQVLHIIGLGKVAPHSYTSPARIEGEHVFYYDDII